MGGTDTSKVPILEMEVFNSSSRRIEKVLDVMGNWINLPNPDFAAGRSVCLTSIEEMNIFVVSVGVDAIR